MKLIIEIPEKRYKDIIRISTIQAYSDYYPTYERIIANGTPLDDIRTEIEHEMNRDIGGSATDFVSGRKCGIGEVLQIIDKHTK